MVRPIDANELWSALSLGPERADHFVSLKAVRKGIESAPTLSLNTLRDAIYQDAVAHGLWEDHDEELASHAEFCAEYPQYAFDLDQGNRSECVLYVLSECFELRDANTAEEYAEELADVVIICMSVAGKLGIDIDAAVRRKMAVNKERPWKHGRAE